MELLKTQGFSVSIVDEANHATSDSYTKAIAFYANVQYSKDLAEEFNKAGLKAKAVDGEMLLDDREKAIEELNSRY